MIDMHIHSQYSGDGEFSPAELVKKCKKQGIRLMSIADHNCVRANQEAKLFAAQEGIGFLSGIEIDCVWDGINFHVLGYGIDFLSPDFETIEQNVERQEKNASLERLEKTQSLGFQITAGDLAAVSEDSGHTDIWTGEMFAEVLLSKPEYRDHPLLKPYRPGGLRADNPYVNFYWDYYAQGKQCYVKIDYPSLEEIIGVIHKNKGTAVLAHPGVNLKGKEDRIDEMLLLGLDGIEAFSSYHTAAQAEYYDQKAQKRGLFVTCGSDYHGKTKPSVQIGQYPRLARGPMEDVFLELQKHFAAAL